MFFQMVTELSQHHFLIIHLPPSDSKWELKKYVDSPMYMYSCINSYVDIYNINFYIYLALFLDFSILYQ